MFKALSASALALLVASAALAATYTTNYSVGKSAYVDLGAGPLEVQVLGTQTASFIVADSQPSAAALGEELTSGLPVKTFCQTSHVWALSLNGSAAVNATPTTCGASGGLSYALASNVGAAGATTPVTGVASGSYLFSCASSTWNSASAQLQALGPDNNTWIAVGTAFTTTGSQGVVVGAGASVRILVTGTPTGLYCNLS